MNSLPVVVPMLVGVACFLLGVFGRAFAQGVIEGIRDRKRA